MKKYKAYMDHIQASDTLHQRLMNLETPRKRPVSWKKYGSLAAALVLVCGLGAWAARANGFEPPIPFYPAGHQQAKPEIVDALQPDIAPEDPDAAVEPGEKTIGGYETTQGGMTTYHILPYIDYGGLKPTAASATQMAADWDIPSGASRRDLTQDEIIALMGGEDAVDTHLDWGEYQLTGWGAWYEDGSFWGAYINGEKIPAGLPQSASYPVPDDRFEFAVTADQLPPTCIVYSASVTQEVRGLTVTADGHDSVAGPEGGVDASTRRVSFMKDGCGYRFDITGVSRALTEERVSRLVARVAGEGLNLSVLPGIKLPEFDPNYDPATCRLPLAPKGNGVSTEPYDPNEAADPSYNAPTESEICGLPLAPSTDPDDAMCSGYPVPGGSETHTCPICGEVLPSDVEHSHLPPDPAESWDLCEGLPEPPEGWTGPDGD